MAPTPLRAIFINSAALISMVHGDVQRKEQLFRMATKARQSSDQRRLVARVAFDIHERDSFYVDHASQLQLCRSSSILRCADEKNARIGLLKPSDYLEILLKVEVNTKVPGLRLQAGSTTEYAPYASPDPLHSTMTIPLLTTSAVRNSLKSIGHRRNGSLFSAVRRSVHARAQCLYITYVFYPACPPALSLHKQL